MRIVKEVSGRRLGLGSNGELIVNRTDGLQEVFGQVRTVTVTSAQLLALNATPISIIPAPGAFLAIVPNRVAIFKTNGTAYADIAAGEDLVLKYTDGSECSEHIETTGFLDQTQSEIRFARGLPSFEPVPNAGVVLHLLVGEITTGDTDLHVRVWYDVIQTLF